MILLILLYFVNFYVADHSGQLSDRLDVLNRLRFGTAHEHSMMCDDHTAAASASADDAMPLTTTSLHDDGDDNDAAEADRQPQLWYGQYAGYAEHVVEDVLARAGDGDGAGAASSESSSSLSISTTPTAAVVRLSLFSHSAHEVRCRM